MARPPLADLDGSHFEVVIIGAGAVGCATARELAERGYRTLLVDRGDIGAGTSARSSRMLYSGVGYLAPRYPLWQMVLHPRDMLERLRYTRQVMRCRAELVRLMPGHLTRHSFHYPFRRGDRYPAWLVGIGFRLADALGEWEFPLSYRRKNRADAAGLSPLAAELGGSLTGVGHFEEYMYAWPERICVDTALDAERRGAIIRTYTAVTGLQRTADRWQVTLEEREPHATGIANLTADLVVNAAGPWIDMVPGAGRGPRVLGVKGVNVMVRLPEGFRGLGLEAFSSKGEPFYVFPWRDLHFMGPTETVVSADPDEIRVEDAEIDYILAEANQLFPRLRLDRCDVLHAWCGVRPTSTLDGRSPVLPVRVVADPATPQLLAVTGSTIMLHRHAARMVARAVEERLGIRADGPHGPIVKPEPPQTAEGLTALVHREHVIRLGDLIRRRLPDGLGPDLGLDRAEELSHALAAAKDWTEDRRHAELRDFHDEVARINPAPTGGGFRHAAESGQPG
ncbi:FAD-dependent oxidoreductase [Paracoccus sp. CPCC 101403]|uniref:FAD-dependent oxidoreductase n=2 Tax=Paracoccus broussonetiae TaxID=3075834 RepID=A0ABU3EA33_9RHOB|nr:FAD-dependent oxidoreductase [Paracoccus sp. CPCC 101403]MDT1061076.1 FAD-dependent oxidoreductase [Paracoccus sp. CPCC 101403]